MWVDYSAKSGSSKITYYGIQHEDKTPKAMNVGVQSRNERKTHIDNDLSSISPKVAQGAQDVRVIFLDPTLALLFPHPIAAGWPSPPL